MKPELLIQEYENARGFIRDLPDHELLALIGRLATDYVVRMARDADSDTALAESVNAGVRFGRAVLEAHRIVLGGHVPGAAG